MSSSTLLFPSNVSSLQSTRSEISKALRDTYNRLHSIAEDAAFISDDVRPAFPDFPIIANQRAGAWYVDSSGSEKMPHAYFKSTDGHIGVHDFNLRRANLILLPVLHEHGGMVIVDSTRRGKRFPDALSKTLPIWCAVLNLARTTLLPPTEENSDVSAEGWKEDGKLWTLPSAIGRSEHDQIEKRIKEWSVRLTSSSYDLSSLLALRKPLRPIFVSPSSPLSPTTSSSYTKFVPVVLCSASKLGSDSEDVSRSKGYSYVQGSGDDHEAWSNGLLPKTFWKHSTRILAASREEIDEVIADILAFEGEEPPSLDALKISSGIEIRSTGVLLDLNASPSSVVDGAVDVLVTSASQPSASTEASDESSKHLIISTRPGKAGFNVFFDAVPQALMLAEEKLRKGEKVVVGVSGEGMAEMGIAMVLMLISRFFDESENTWLGETDGVPPKLTKESIRKRLQWILEAFPEANPHRAILTRVNEFLISRSSNQLQLADFRFSRSWEATSATKAIPPQSGLWWSKRVRSLPPASSPCPHTFHHLSSTITMSYRGEKRYSDRRLYGQLLVLLDRARAAQEADDRELVATVVRGVRRQVTIEEVKRELGHLGRIADVLHPRGQDFFFVCVSFSDPAAARKCREQVRTFLGWDVFIEPAATSRRSNPTSFWGEDLPRSDPAWGGLGPRGDDDRRAKTNRREDQLLRSGGMREDEPIEEEVERRRRLRHLGDVAESARDESGRGRRGESQRGERSEDGQQKGERHNTESSASPRTTAHDAPHMSVDVDSDQAYQRVHQDDQDRCEDLSDYPNRFAEELLEKLEVFQSASMESREELKQEDEGREERSPSAGTPPPRVVRSEDSCGGKDVRVNGFEASGSTIPMIDRFVNEHARLVIRNLSREVSSDLLQEIGSECGAVVAVCVHAGCWGEGLLEYSTPHEADVALVKLNGQELTGRGVRLQRY
ncbi:tRNA A64-2'-O-ribosylphosphate transferase [Pseudohyphozyma bogoriensis]|nr:tRNA A64-2'-O-ribosylphosphate transferase [Pseudohyphozyma bogoriensis]